MVYSLKSHWNQGSVNLPVCISVTLYKSTSFSIVLYTVVLAGFILKPNESVWHFNFILSQENEH